nr:PREDICTED: LOW QUALITY PROTEIN: uncharacterized protein LOC105677165 [Linepithema humile]
MSTLKSVIITLPKGLPKAISANEFACATTPRLNFVASLLTDKAKMDARKVTVRQQEEVHDDGVTTLIKTADGCVRGKKRRLDHLTWEEKLQRKKLKNRMAAQTSRDRKKARLDELMETVNTLTEKNKLLTQECTMLRTQNESLLSETKRLKRERDTRTTMNEDQQQQQYCSMCQTRVGCAVPSLGSAVSPDDPLPQGGTAQPASCLTLTPGGRPAEDSDPLPPLEELFSDLQSDDYIERLEELAESLLREVTAEMEANPHRSNEQVSNKEDSVKKPDHSETVVGQASENVEADRVGGSVNGASYLRGSTDWHPIVCSTASTAVAPSTLIKTEIEIKEESEPTPDLETVYGTYDEATNSITIIYPGEENGECVGIQECVQEVVSTVEHGGGNGVCHVADDGVVARLAVPSSTHLGYPAQFSPAYTDTMSPAMSDIHSDADNYGVSAKLDCTSLSDGGYESHDSPEPRRSNSLADLWHESFTELFPTLA